MRYGKSAVHHVLLQLVLSALVGISHAFSARVNKVVSPSGTYFGATVDYPYLNYSLKGVGQQLGIEPATYVMFTQIPLPDYDLWAIDQILPQIAQRGISIILTPEPYEGLDSVTDAAITRFVDIVTKYENKGATIIVRFAHEMNGSWYPWCQQPTKYKAVFQRFANILKKRTKRATILWGPNVGPGYPYIGGKYQFNCTERPLDCEELETNGDGTVDALDDMFSPYWPGDEYVDWIGTSLYWWGDTWPWGENEVPYPEYFSDILLGRILAEANTTIPDFYTTYAKNKNKAMIVTETAALYNLCDKKPNSSECLKNAQGIIQPSALDIKSAWWNQIFSTDGENSLRVAFPNIKIVSWFDIKKVEQEAAGNTVDWSVSEDPIIKSAFIEHITSSRAYVNGGSKNFWLSGTDFRQRVWGKKASPPLKGL